MTCGPKYLTPISSFSQDYPEYKFSENASNPSNSMYKMILASVEHKPLDMERCQHLAQKDQECGSLLVVVGGDSKYCQCVIRGESSHKKVKSCCAQPLHTRKCIDESDLECRLHVCRQQRKRCPSTQPVQNELCRSCRSNRQALCSSQYTDNHDSL